MKKWIIIVLSMAVFAVAGCSSDNNSSPPGANNTPPPGNQTPAPTPTPPPVTPAAATTLEPISGGNQAAAVAVNETGLIVGHSEPLPGARLKAVFWSTGGPATPMQDLAGAPAGGYSAAYDVNAVGAVVGEAENGTGGFTAVYWSSTAAAPAALAPLGVGNTFSAAYGVNTGGMIVGEAENNAFEVRAVVWSSDTAAPVDLGVLPGGTGSTAYAINDGGVIAGDSDDGAGKRHAVVWEPNGAGYDMIDLGIAGEAGSTASGISATGIVVGETEVAPGQIQAVAWTPGAVPGAYTRQDLGTAGIESSANSITGNRAVGYRNDGTANEAVEWDMAAASIVPEPIAGTPADSQAYAATLSGIVVGKAGAAGFLFVP